MLKKEVLRKKSDFSAIYNKGKSFGERYVVLFHRANNLPYNRMGYLASKKVGNSVKRNRARRLMKESFRQLEKEFVLVEGRDLIIIARNTIGNTSMQEVKKSMYSAFKKSGLLKEKRSDGK
ncbi:MAG: ribonuclease P protein component [Anaerovoracaceae bacterium]|jgi:ribonuclease P protein component|nr:ribonuclease P protein component [Anaerovoracaceae bacterium]